MPGMDDADKSEIVEGRIFQKGVTPVRAFVAAPMRYGRLFLAGDAAHIVPPTGAKGLNLAVADVRVLARALTAFLRKHDGAARPLFRHLPAPGLEGGAVSPGLMTTLLHRFPDPSPFERNIQLGELDYLLGSRAGSDHRGRTMSGCRWKPLDGR